MKRAMPSGVLLLVLAALSGCGATDSPTAHSTDSPTVHSQSAKAESFFGLGAREHLVAGTALRIRLLEPLSSETARAGDTWHGVVQAPVVVDGDEVVGTGSSVEGIVTAVLPAQGNSRAMLEIEMRKVGLNDHETSLRATTDPVIAGSPRARNLAAIAGDAAEGTVDAEAAGNAGAGGAVSRDYQVLLPEGAVMTFTVSREVAMR